MKSKYPGSTISRVEYQLGGIVGGSLYYYTAIPATRTLAAALELQRNRSNRSTCDVIVECGELAAGGVRWGLQTRNLSAVDGSELP